MKAERNLDGICISIIGDGKGALALESAANLPVSLRVQRLAQIPQALAPLAMSKPDAVLLVAQQGERLSPEVVQALRVTVPAAFLLVYSPQPLPGVQADEVVIGRDFPVEALAHLLIQGVKNRRGLPA